MVAKGFKNTEVGVIPEDWEVDFLSKITDLVTDGAHLSPPTSRDGFPIATVENINKGFINIESCRIISDKDYLYLVRNNCKPITGDVLLSKDGTIGITFVINDNPNVVLLSSIALIRPNTASLTSEYLSQVFRSYWFYIYLNRVQAGSALTRIVLRDIKNFYLALPPLPEQKAIAEALSDADDWIANLEQLISKKRLIKQGAMQQLLSPKEGWEVKKLGEVVTFKNGAAHENVVDENGAFVIVNSKFISQEGQIRKHSNACLCPLFKDEIVMVMSDIPNGKALAKCFIIDKDDTYTLNQRICAFKVNEDIDGTYLFYKINRNDYYLAFDSGSGQTNLRKAEVLDCPVYLPKTKQEQTHIAAILSDMDNEIEILEKQLAKARQIKQGMMQELLTGKTRLIK